MMQWLSCAGPTRRAAFSVALIIAVLLIAPARQSAGEAIFRLPVGAGSFYPEDPDELKKAVADHYAAVSPPLPSGRLLACIVPHSGFQFCGDVIANAFKHLKLGEYSKVILLAPCHYANFDGCSIAEASAFVTPIGVTPLSGVTIRELTYSALISSRALHYGKSFRHVKSNEVEHAIEVPLPFLQYSLGNFGLVPMLVGNLKDASGRFSEASIEVIAASIKKVLDERTLLVVSTDFTHFGNAFSFRPFEKDIPANIEQLDREAFRLLLQRDFDGFQRYLKETRNPICGATCLQILMKILPPQAQGVLLDYVQSAQQTGNPDRSVSYAAINFYDPTLPPLKPPVIVPSSPPVPGVSNE